MILSLLLSVCCSNPQEVVAVDIVDLVEINHQYDEQGNLVLDQIIWYDWDRAKKKYEVRAWRLLKRPNQTPIKSGNFWVAVWNDGPILRQVKSRQFRETWTQYDREIRERQSLTPNKRKPLFSFKLKPY